jgi:hypothetical protein
LRQSCKISLFRSGGTAKANAIQSFMKQPTDQQERNEDKKLPKDENPSHGIDPEPIEPEMEAGQEEKKKDAA